MKKKLIFLTLLFVKTYGGDPCPIPLVIYNAGVPSWQNEAEILKGLEFNRPLVGIYSSEFDDGIEITDIDKGSVAEIVDLRVDDVIVKIDGELVLKERDVSRLVNKKLGGELITFELLRKKKKIIKTFRLGSIHEDPLIYALRMFAKDNECLVVFGEKLDKKERQQVESKIFEKFKRFDCNNAHTKLKELSLRNFNFDDTTAVMMRGKKRILISYVGEKTLCLDSADYRGKNLTKQRVAELYEKLFKEPIDYIEMHP